MGAALEVAACCSWERDVLVGCVECGGGVSWGEVRGRDGVMGCGGVSWVWRWRWGLVVRGRDVLVGCVECGGEERREMGWRRGGFCGLGCAWVGAVDLRAVRGRRWRWGDGIVYRARRGGVMG